MRAFFAGFRWDFTNHLANSSGLGFRVLGFSFVTPRWSRELSTPRDSEECIEGYVVRQRRYARKRNSPTAAHPGNELTIGVLLRVCMR